MKDACTDVKNFSLKVHDIWKHLTLIGMKPDANEEDYKKMYKGLSTTKFAFV